MSNSWENTNLWKKLESYSNPDSKILAASLRDVMPQIEVILKSSTSTPKDFTLHDNEHSFRVAERMVEIIENYTYNTVLTEYEISFLLLSAYLHDIGMCPELEHVEKYEKYVKFGENSITDDEREKFIQWVNNHDETIQVPLCDTNGQISKTKENTANELLTYFIRHMHNDWSAEWINNNPVLSNLKLAKYHTWRSDLILVCKSHHYGLEELKSEDFDPVLAYANTPVHLRYIAMVLRVADVMEIDPERTPDVLIKYRNIHTKSIKFWEKDAQIVLTISDDDVHGKKVSVSATPSRAYLHKACLETINEIENELKLCNVLSSIRPLNICPAVGNNLKHKWNLLPDVYKNVKPYNNVYEYIDGAFRPNTKKVLQIIAGTALYGDYIYAVREVIQNAFDAIKEIVAYKRLEKNNPADDKWSKLIGDEHSVELSVEFIDSRYWLICKDDGIGMSKSIIENYILVSGSSNTHSTNELERKCSKAGFSFERTGQFGIGVLSYFMIAEKIIIKTKRYKETEEADNFGWEFEINGLSDFGELKRIDFKKGTHVAILLKGDLIDKTNAEAWVIYLQKKIKEIVKKTPCNFIFNSEIVDQKNFSYETGWTESEEDFIQLIESDFLGSIDNFPKTKNKHFLREEVHITRLSETNVNWNYLTTLKEKLRWKTIEGDLPNNYGFYKISLPYFELNNGFCLYFANDGIDNPTIELQKINQGCFWIPRPRDISYSWKGMSLSVEYSNRISSNLFIKIELTSNNGSVVFSVVNFWNENGRLEIVMQTLSTALDKVTSFVQARINNVSGLTKPQRKFLLWLFDRWLMLPVRYNFLNLGRYGGYSEKAIRSQMSIKLPFLALFHQLFAGLSKKECVAAFDPTFIAKSGKRTYGLAKYWSGTAQQVKKGLEAGCLAIVDVEDSTAYSMEVVQTPVAAETESLMDHYTRLITQRLADIVKYTTILTVDGYFMKEGFIKAVTGVGLKVITKARQDANMLYLYKGAQHKGPGAKRKYSGKIKWKSIDQRVFKLCYRGDDMMAYEAVVWSVSLKQQLKVVYVKARERKGYEVLVCTDTEMKGEKVLSYYRLRFQIEFLIRDAKTHTGLDHCQGRSEEKLYNHFNMAMISVSVVKYQTWAKLPDKEEVSFSMRSIKTYCWNQYMTLTIFANLALDMSCNKIKRLYNQCLNIGSMAA